MALSFPKVDGHASAGGVELEVAVDRAGPREGVKHRRVQTEVLVHRLQLRGGDLELVAGVR